MSTEPESKGREAPVAGEIAPDDLPLPGEAILAFRPLHKRALGIACGVAGGGLVFALTLFHLVVLRGDPTGLHLLGQYFYGYEVSWTGAFVGLFWGFVSCFVFGWFAAFLRNLVLASFLFLARTRAELRQTRDFLDHI